MEKGGTLEIWGKHGNCYFPIQVFDLEALEKAGFGQEFMLKYTGQLPQLNEDDPSLCRNTTPHSESPEQDLNSVTEGIPGLTVLTEQETTTVFFATGQSK